MIQRCRFGHCLFFFFFSFTLHATIYIPCFPLSSLPWPRRPQKMQNIPLSLSSMIPCIRSLSPNPITKFTQLSRPVSSLAINDFHSPSLLSSRKASYSPSSSRLGTSTSASFLTSSRKNVTFKVGAALMPEAQSDEPRKRSALIRTMQLAAMFGIWYLLNIYFNIYNKQVLKVYPFPATVTAFQFGYTTLMIILIWTFNLHPRPKISRSQLGAIFPLAVTHTIGNLLTNISIGKVAVSFTHTIKALEPLFTVILSSLFLGEQPTFPVVSSLLPIAGGVALASMTEVSFNWIGFCCAMASNLINQSRNVLSKKLMVNEEEALDNINLYSVITIISFFLSLPFVISTEGFKLTPSYLQSAASQGLNVRELCLRLVLAGFCFHAYQQVSYGILQMVTPVTHSVANCLKRVVVIVSSVIFFQTTVSPANKLGTAVALGGVFLYSRAKRTKPKPKPA